MKYHADIIIKLLSQLEFLLISEMKTRQEVKTFISCRRKRVRSLSKTCV